MAEYIEREAVIKRIREVYCADCNNYNSVICRACGTGDAIDMFEDAPAADVAPVVHGRWILERTPDGKPYCFHCSACDSDYHHIGITVATDYCPNCGAKMDGGADNAADRC